MPKKKKQNEMKCPKCLKCENFALWDGDYVCMSKLETICRSNNDFITDDVIDAIRANKACSNFALSSSLMTQALIEEFNSWNDLKRLEKQLEMHVSDHRIRHEKA